MPEVSNIPIVDTWEPEPEDIIFTNKKSMIICPITDFFQVDKDPNYSKINFFFINSKKSYNADALRNHTCKYMNYLEKYFDVDKEYFSNLARIKFMVDIYPEYDFNNFILDIQRYILQPSLFEKTRQMTVYNYGLNLSYKSANNPQLCYTDEHGIILMQISILMNMLIPIITHFAYMRRVPDINEFLLDIYDYILYAPVFQSADIVSKLYETSISNVTRHEKNNTGSWIKQSIRGRDTVTHSVDAVRNIILNIIPKYQFNQNMISLNYTSIQNSNKYQITDISYEFSYISLSSSKRDSEDNSSDFDRYEANLTKVDESLYLASKVNCETTMRTIEQQWGPFDEDEIDFYIRELKSDNRDVVNGFQKQLIFNLFYKYFGDTVSICAINVRDYIKLMLAAKKMLLQNRMSYLPYIISGKVNKIIARKSLNKRELIEMEHSQSYPRIMEKYSTEKVKSLILGTIATIITSTFMMIDYHNRDINGKQIINVDPRIIIEETLLYILLI